MTSYDAESDGPNFSPEHGVQLTDPRFLEYVGAPESSRLMSRSPEYWVHHMGVENVGRPAVTTRRRTCVIERSGTTAISDVDVPDFIRRASGSPRTSSVPVQCATTGDTVA